MTHELVSANNATQVVEFFRHQFKNPDQWCDLDELILRLNSQIPNEVIGVADIEDNRVVGAVIAYRNPFSSIEWTIPIVAIEKGNPETELPSLRRQGRGRELMARIYQEIITRGGKSVLADTNKDHKMGGSPEFLQAVGLTQLCELPGYFENDANQTGLLFIRHL